MLVDAAVHVWSDDPGAFPWAPIGGASPPDHSATVAELVAAQEEVGVEAAVCVQPRVYGYDHRFLASVLAAHPERFAGVCLVHPTDGGGPAELRRLVLDCGCAGVRLLPFSERTVAWLAGSSGDPLWAQADALAVPVSVLARPDQLRDLADRARRHPGTTVVVDHLGMVVPSEDPSAVRRLLACADVENMWVKVSALGFVSRVPWPYDDLHPMLRQVVAAFGPGRVMVGTDWPNARAYGPYRLTFEAFDRAVDLDDTARALVLGENARRLWSVGAGPGDGPASR